MELSVAGMPQHSKGRFHWPRWLPSPRLVVSLLSLVAVVVLALRATSARHQFEKAFQNFQLRNLPWLAAAVGAETVSIVCYAAAQRRLLISGQKRVKLGPMVLLTAAATGISDLVPAGVVPAGGWLVDQYRRRGVPVRMALWAVLAGGFAASVTVLALLLVGAGIAGVGNALVIGMTGVVLVCGSALFVIAIHRVDALERYLRRHHMKTGVRAAHWASVHAADLTGFRAGWRGGSEVLLFSALNWLFDTACLLSAFAFLGLPLPWKSALFAYTVSQVARSLVPLPAGIGIVEGGMLGVFRATGSAAGAAAGGAFAAIVIYRVVGYWALAAIGSIIAFVISHRDVGAIVREASPDPAEAGIRTPATVGSPQPAHSQGCA